MGETVGVRALGQGGKVPLAQARLSASYELGFDVKSIRSYLRILTDNVVYVKNYKEKLLNRS